MSFIKENYPLIGFIAVYLISKDLVLAAAVWSGGSLLQIVTSLITRKPIKKTHIGYFVLGIILLLLAYYFNNDNFIKWKTSIMLWAGTLVILFRQLFNKKYIIQDLLQTNGLLKDSAPVSTLRKINALWVIFLASFGFINLYIAYNFSTEFWFYFKLIGLFVLTMGLFVVSMLMLKEHLNLDDENETPEQQG